MSKNSLKKFIIDGSYISLNFFNEIAELITAFEVAIGDKKGDQ